MKSSWKSVINFQSYRNNIAGLLFVETAYVVSSVGFVWTYRQNCHQERRESVDKSRSKVYEQSTAGTSVSAEQADNFESS